MSSFIFGVATTIVCLVLCGINLALEKTSLDLLPAVIPYAVGLSLVAGLIAWGLAAVVIWVIGTYYGAKPSIK